MRVLFYVDSYYPFEDSNSNALAPIVQQLARECEVDVLTSNHDGSAAWEERLEGVHVQRYRRFRGMLGRIASLAFAPSRHGRGWIQDRVAALLQPLSRVLFRLFPRSDYSVLRRLVRSGEIDILVTVTSPVRPQVVALKLSDGGVFKKYRVSWVPYFMDPHASYIGNADKSAILFWLEERIYASSVLVITTPEIRKENHNNVLAQYLSKTVAVPFGNLRPLQVSRSPVLMAPDRVNCVFVGSLQDVAIRDPEYLFEMISLCDDTLLFHMVVSRWSQDTLEMRTRHLDDARNVIWYDRMSWEESLGAVATADVVINVGNRSTNQLPGKVYEYVASGLPIVNVHPYSSDTSAEFLRRYPMVLDIDQSRLAPILAVAALEEFARRERGQRLDFSEVAERYSEYLSENVYNKFSTILYSARPVARG